VDRRSAKHITQAILGVGLLTSVLIFSVAKPVDEFPLGYDPLTNKKYVLELERYGGKANVATAELLQWFNALWHGRNLAYTVAVLTVLAALLFWVMSTLPPADETPSDGPSEA
jgi:hypothetical protein